jgi:hypothetical protein
MERLVLMAGHARREYVRGLNPTLDRMFKIQRPIQWSIHRKRAVMRRLTQISPMGKQTVRWIRRCQRKPHPNPIVDVPVRHHRKDQVILLG